MIDVFTAPDKNQHAHDHHEDVEREAQQVRPGQVHREAAEQVVHVFAADRVGNDHAGEQRDHAGADHGVDADHVAGVAQVLQLGIGDLAVNLRQRFESAHGEQRVAERDDDRHGADLRPEGSVEPAERVRAEMQIARERRGRNLNLRRQQQRDGAPDQEHTTITVVICMMRSALPLDS